jgi:hypothetical protein
MKNVLTLVALLVSTATAWALEIRELTSPAGPGAMGASLTRDERDAIYLTWLEPEGGDHVLKFSRLLGGATRWTEPMVIARGAGWFANWADFPQLAVADGKMTAVWFVENAGQGYRAYWSQSRDQGATWTRAAPLSTESDHTEFTALQPMGDGRVLAVWLDARARAKGEEKQMLCARFLGEDGPDMVIDAMVCDCCQIALTPLRDGGVLAAYRGRNADEVRDIKVSRFNGRKWSRPEGLHRDGWKIAGCPVNGPRLVTDGSWHGVAWFTGANDQPAVHAALSVDGGETFEAARIDLGKPEGRVDTALLKDGTMLVAWLERAGAGKEGGIYLRGLTADNRLTEPEMLAPTKTTRASGFPRIVMRDANTFVLAFTRDLEPSRLATLVVRLR